jgi:hypothetical protein
MWIKTLSQAPTSVLAVSSCTTRKCAEEPLFELCGAAHRSRGINSAIQSATLARRSGPLPSWARGNGQVPESIRHEPCAQHSESTCCLRVHAAAGGRSTSPHPAHRGVCAPQVVLHPNDSAGWKPGRSDTCPYVAITLRGPSAAAGATVSSGGAHTHQVSDNT